MNLRILAFCFLLLIPGLSLVAGEQPAFSQTLPKRTPEELKALLTKHQGDFDYLLGDWEFTSNNKQWGKGHGFWSAVRIAEGAQVLDEFRVTGDDGETIYASSTVRSYNAVLDQWELISAETGTGLQNFGTAQLAGTEMRIEQKFGVMSDKPWILRIRYYNIKADSFSWSADRSLDGGKTWDLNNQQIEAKRIGPSRSLGQLAPYRKPAGKTN